MNAEKREPCIICGQESNDWMVGAKLIHPDKSICGKCKIEIGKKILEDLPKKYLEGLKK